MMRHSLSFLVLALVVAVEGSAQPARQPAFDGVGVRAWSTRVLEDSSQFRRVRAAAAIRRAPPAFRRALVSALVPALEGGAPEQKRRAIGAIQGMVNEGQFGPILEDRGFDLTPAVPVLMKIASDPSDRTRRAAWFLLARTDSATRRTLAPAARAALADPDPGIRWEAVRFLALVRDSADLPGLLAATGDTSAEVREIALLDLSRWHPRPAISAYMRALADTATSVREAAIIGLGRAGPAASRAIPALLQLLADSTQVPRTVRANAAWALPLILPRWDVDLPLQLEISDAGAGVRSDGLGRYLHGVDSVSVTKGATVNLDLGGARGDGRATTLRTIRPLRRFLVIDLSRPVPGSGATSLGLIRDNEAAVHMASTHVHLQSMISISRIEPSDTLVAAERVEFQFRINGAAHLLQMGEWTQGEFNRTVPQVSGAGTSTARISHPDLSSWTIFAPEGSLARLWDLSDPQRPVDRGLYVVPFRFRWSLLDAP